MDCTAKRLADGDYWMVYEINGNTRRSRVVVGPDADGVQRARWADADWRPMPPISGGDIGLRVDQLPESTRFEVRELAVEADECSQVASRPVVDSRGRPLAVGRYELYAETGTDPTHIVDIQEDEISGDLVALTDGLKIRVDEITAKDGVNWVRVR